jgi:hypothetical protein
MSKRFKARAASLDGGIICGRLVSSQLSVQLPQNSGARGKGNWPSEVSRLQYLAGCPICWRCDVISKRMIKSRPNTRKVMARARNWEIYSNRSKGRAKAWEGRHASSGPRPSRYRTQFPFQPRRAGTSPSFPEPASRSTAPFALRLEDPARRVCASQ